MSKVLFKISGSIAAYKACSVISALVQQGHEVQVVATKDVFHFVGESTFEGLTGRSVLSDIHHQGDVMAHIHLNTWADISILCPASANTMAKIANGLADNLVTTLALARVPETPYLLFPAMNPKMWSAPATQDNVKRLQNYGFQIHNGEAGRMACGDVGEGRLLEPDQILQLLKPWLQEDRKTTKRSRVLVTAGGTSEKIDAVRVFTNTSSGRTGAQIAKKLSDAFDVTFVGSASAIKALEALRPACGPAIAVLQYESFADLQLCLKTELGTHSYEAVVHAAAVSDFKPVAITQEGERYPLPLAEKLKTSPSLEVVFEQNPKLIQNLKDWSLNPRVTVFGFKLLQDKTPEHVAENVEKILKSSDYVVLNFIDEVSENQHQYSLYKSMQKGLVAHGSTNIELADHILDLLRGSGETHFLDDVNINAKEL
ncbi:MAG: bifunctional phosphopantothenoylcysteine decarboxylase/phosphopantothenate--cysteine ligase CoaBC [Bdellovibrionaceae bacterium]|nr:bifunctional phosphopantothenoylcysteine decarboxylase/phosphopantothenate--cysteine ligase CoaBC [Pseudobdellovibrionaceae bacterium]